MAQSLAKIYLHTVFSTKYRQPLITAEVEVSLHAYIAGIIYNLGSIPIAINGVEDHIHILSTLPRTITVAKYLQEIKRDSSKWIKTQGLAFKNFAWQNGYGTFSVSSYKLETVKRYIDRQKEHHKGETFKRELIRHLEAYQIEYDEQYLWD